jgi:hypothetical protein
MAEDKDEEGGGFFSGIISGITAFFMAIIEIIVFIFDKIYWTLWAIVKCFEFIWYPIK